MNYVLCTTVLATLVIVSGCDDSKKETRVPTLTKQSEVREPQGFPQASVSVETEIDEEFGSVKTDAIEEASPNKVFGKTASLFICPANGWCSKYDVAECLSDNNFKLCVENYFHDLGVEADFRNLDNYELKSHVDITYIK